MKNTILVILLASAAPLVGAADWYVATDGNNNNAGTEAAPFATIQHAIDHSADGDTVIVHGGTYERGAEPLTIGREDLTLKAFPGERPLIRADVGGPFAAVYFEEDNCDGSRFEGFEVEGGKHGIQVGSSWNHNVSDSPEDQYTCDDIVIHRNVIHDVTREGIKLPAGVRNVTITNNEVFNTGVEGATNAECIDAVGVINLHVAGNYLHHCASNGIYAKGGSVNAVIENNLITDVSQNTGNGAGIYLGFTTTDFQLFDRENNPQLFESINSVARNNIVIRSRGPGIGVQSALNAQVHNNTLIDVAQDAHAGIRLAPGQLCTSIPMDCGEDQINHSQTNVKPEIFNNIVISGGREVVGVDDGGIDTESAFAINHNWYHLPDGNPAFRWLGTGGLGMVEWQNQSTQDANSGSGDPGLDEDFHLTAASTALINMGVFLADVGADYDGQPRTDGSVDIGADEHGNGTILPVPPLEGAAGTGLGQIEPPGSPDDGGDNTNPDDDTDDDDTGGENPGNGDDGESPAAGDTGGGSMGFALLALMAAGRSRRRV